MPQKTLTIPSSGEVLNNSDYIDIDIECQYIQRTAMSYGYGLVPVSDELTYFDAFDIIGGLEGYFTDPFNDVSGTYGYGYGYELTHSLREGVLEDDQLLQMDITITPAAAYTINIGIVGPGQLFLYYDSDLNSYSTTFVEGTNQITYDAVTNGSGELSIKIGVPYSVNEVSWHRGWIKDDATFQEMYKPRGAGLVDVYISVPGKIIQPDTITATATLTLVENYLTVPCYGYINNALVL